jgi:hypothetical protein
MPKIFYKLYVYRIVQRLDGRFLVRRRFLGLPFSSEFLESICYRKTNTLNVCPNWWILSNGSSDTDRTVEKWVLMNSALEAKMSFDAYLEYELGRRFEPNRIVKVFTPTDPELLTIAAEDKLSGRAK